MRDEGGQRSLGLGSHQRRDVRRHDVHHVDGRLEVAAERRRVGQRELGVGSAADRRQDALDVLDAALLDDRDVAWRVAHDLVDRRREDRRVALLAAGPTRPAKDDQVGFLLRGQLDDSLGSPAADAHDRAQLNPRWRELEHALQQPARLPRTSGTFR